MYVPAFSAFKRAGAALALSLAACAPLSMASSPSAAAFSFALVGDAPYRRGDEHRFAEMLQQINADPSLRFILHAGDVKGSGEPCTDELLRRRLAQFAGVDTALVYTPGDNEWTDCHRAAAGRFHPLERLAVLRRLAFPQPGVSFGRRPLALQSQSTVDGYRRYVENVMFDHQHVLFATLHVVGSNNGLEPWRGIDRFDSTRSPRSDRLAEFHERQEANLSWLRRAFRRATEIDAAGVVLLMQANARLELPRGAPAHAGFEPVIDELARLARGFGRPVLLAHGDGHVFLVDRPLANDAQRLPSLLRVQTFGHPWMGWARVDVDPQRADVFFVRSQSLYDDALLGN